MLDEIFPRSHPLWPAFDLWWADAKLGVSWRDAWQAFIAGADAGVKEHINLHPAYGGRVGPVPNPYQS